MPHHLATDSITTVSTDPPHAPSSTPPALRTIAAFEGFKAILALAAGAGLLGLLHHDLRAVAAALIGHVGLSPGDHYPALVLHDLALIQHARLRTLMLAMLGYVAVRSLEAYALWHGRRWGEWLGALSGALYLPFEAQHLLHRPSIATAATMAVNLAVVCYLGWQLHRRQARLVASPPPHRDATPSNAPPADR